MKINAKYLSVFFFLLIFSCKKEKKIAKKQVSVNLSSELKEKTETVEKYLDRLKKGISDFDTIVFKRDINFPLKLRDGYSRHEFTFKNLMTSNQGKFLYNFLEKIEFIKNENKFKDVEGIVFYEKINIKGRFEYLDEKYQIEFYINEFEDGFKLTKINIIY